MKKKILIIVILVLLVALIVPATVSAAGTFYCSALKASGGNGSWSNPWACSNQSQFDDVFDTICNVYGGGHLYRIFSDHYIYYRIDYYGQNECVIGYESRYPGYPPDTGPDIPMPILITGGVAAGALLVVAGLLIRRKTSKAS
jgi:LPXTG-motif cell wall-anchored protein